MYNVSPPGTKPLFAYSWQFVLIDLGFLWPDFLCNGGSTFFALIFLSTWILQYMSYSGVIFVQGTATLHATECRKNWVLAKMNWVLRKFELSFGKFNRVFATFIWVLRGKLPKFCWKPYIHYFGRLSIAPWLLKFTIQS